jgi:hypothetical protein
MPSGRNVRQRLPPVLGGRLAARLHGWKQRLASSGPLLSFVGDRVVRSCAFLAGGRKLKPNVLHLGRRCRRLRRAVRVRFDVRAYSGDRGSIARRSSCPSRGRPLSRAEEESHRRPEPSSVTHYRHTVAQQLEPYPCRDTWNCEYQSHVHLAGMIEVYAKSFGPLRERGHASCARKLRKQTEEVSGAAPVGQVLHS